MNEVTEYALKVKVKEKKEWRRSSVYPAIEMGDKLMLQSSGVIYIRQKDGSLRKVK